jgi:hypothetical protein
LVLLMPTPHWSRETIAAAIAAFHQRTGRWPVSADFVKRHGLPAVSVVHAHWGGLDAARHAAGMPVGALPRQGAAWLRTWPETQARLGQMTEEGEEG